MLKSSLSFSQLLKLAAKAWVIFWLVPGVNGGTCVGRSKIKSKILIRSNKTHFYCEIWIWKSKSLSLIRILKLFDEELNEKLRNSDFYLVIVK